MEKYPVINGKMNSFSCLDIDYDRTWTLIIKKE